MGRHSERAAHVQEPQVCHQVWELCIHCGIPPQSTTLQRHHHCHQGWLCEDVEPGHTTAPACDEGRRRALQFQLHRHIKVSPRPWPHRALAIFAPLLSSASDVRLGCGLNGASRNQFSVAVVRGALAFFNFCAAISGLDSSWGKFAEVQFWCLQLRIFMHALMSHECTRAWCSVPDGVTSARPYTALNQCRMILPRLLIR